MNRRFLPYMLSATTSLTAVAQQPAVYTANAQNIHATMEKVGAELVRADRARNIDVIIVGETHDRVSHRAGELVLYDYLAREMPLAGFAVENQSSHTEMNQWFYEHVNKKAQILRQDDRPSTFDLLGDMAQWMCEEQYCLSSYRLLGTCVMSLYNVKRTNVDCERNYDEELVDDAFMPGDVRKLLQSSPYFQAIGEKHPAIFNPFGLDLESKEGMIYRNLVMAANIKKLVDENKGTILSENGSAHIYDREFPDAVPLDEMLAEMGLNVATVFMDDKESITQLNRSLADSYESGAKAKIDTHLFVGLPGELIAKGYASKLYLRAIEPHRNADNMAALQTLIPLQ